MNSSSLWNHKPCFTWIPEGITTGYNNLSPCQGWVPLFCHCFSCLKANEPSIAEAGKALASLCLQEPAEHPPDVHRHPLDQSQAMPPGLPVLLLFQSKLSQIKNKSNLLEHKQPDLIYFKHQDLLKLNKIKFNPISPKVQSGISDSHRPNIPALILSSANQRITNFAF